MGPAPGLDALTWEHFANHIGEGFRLELADRALELGLVEAVPRGTAAGGRRRAFSLLFRGPAEPLLPQAIYRLVHPGLGALDLFLVPVEATPDGVHYEAIFN